MAKQYVDAAVETVRDSISKSSGAALTLTNDVRILYDDTLSTEELVACIDKMKERILEIES